MSEFLSETEGCTLLTRLFKARGYKIERNVLFHEYGVEFHVDGWDANARVGFEFLTSEDEDHDDLTVEEYQTLATAQQKGELSLFIIDEVEPLSAADLTAAANEFLDEVADAVEARRVGGPARMKRPPAKRVVASRSPAKGKRSSVERRAKAARPAAAAGKKAVKRGGKQKPAKKKVAKKPVKKPVKTAANKTAAKKKVRRSK